MSGLKYIQIPVELEQYKSDLYNIFINPEVKTSDDHQKPFGGIGIGFFLGFVISYLGSEALSGVLSGMGIKVQKPFKIVGEKISRIPYNIKRLYEISSKSENIAGGLKIHIEYGGFKLIFTFFNIKTEEQFFIALISIDNFLSKFFYITAEKLKKENYPQKEIIIIKWDGNSWKIDSFMSNFL